MNFDKFIDITDELCKKSTDDVVEKKPPKILVWTEEELDILREGYKNQEPLNDIMKKLPGRSYGAISSKAVKIGLAEEYMKPNNTNYRGEYSDYNWCYERFITRGMIIPEISQETGYKVRTLEKWIHEKYHLDYKKDFRLNDKQKMVVTSGTLGDGHISRLNSYIESHAENQKDYMYWKFDILRNMCLMKEPSYYPPTVKYFGDKGYNCQAAYRVTTRSIDDLANIREMSNTEKINYLDDLGFVLHFLDDGHYNGTNWEICLAEWEKEEKYLYIKRLYELFNAEAYVIKDDRYIRLDKNSSDIMNKVILKNMPHELDIIQYKIINAKR